MSKIANAVADILTSQPHLGNDEVADMIKGLHPGARTTPASVGSIKSRLRRDGVVPAGPRAPRRVNGSVNAGASVKGFDPMRALTQASAVAAVAEEVDDPEERTRRIRGRYDALERMARRVAEGKLPALIVSGPPGLGKSYTVEMVLEELKMSEEYDVVSGSMSAIGLYIALYNTKDGGVLVLDDCDSVFRDEEALNLLKAVLDSSESRVVSWRKRSTYLDELEIPDSFQYKGSIVFCTNLDFEVAIAKGTALAPHFEALIDRSLYLALTMRTVEDVLERIRQVAIEDNMLVCGGLTDAQADEIMQYVRDNVSRFYTLSLRLVYHIGLCRIADPEHWREDVAATKMRTI